MATLYLNEELHADAFAVGARVPVRGADARHAAQVARVRTGERIGIGDGRGRIAWGPVVHVANDQVAIEVDSVQRETPARPTIRLVQALAKGDRDELAIQAATELGVAGVVPWQAARSVVRWEGPKLAKGLERWRAIVREAAKQAIRPSVPEVAEPVTTKGLAALLGERIEPVGARLALVLEPSSGTPLSEAISDEAFRSAAEVLLIVGPEGGIAPEELLALEVDGARIVRLGSEVLRTSTAGPAAIAALRGLLGQW